MLSVRRAFRAPLLLALACAPLLATTGCATKRETVSARTAVEQAVITQAADAVLADLAADLRSANLTRLAGRSFALVGDAPDRTDARYIIDQMRLALLRAGLREVSADDADLHVTPVVSHAGTDEHLFFIGIPSIPILVPGAGQVSTPELALFKRDALEGGVRAGLFAVERLGGALAFAVGQHADRRSYVQYRLLFLLGWTNTDLLAPHGDASEATDAQATAAPEAEAESPPAPGSDSAPVVTVGVE